VRNVDYLRAILSGVAASLLATFGPGFWFMFQGIGERKATGLTAVAGGFPASLLSPFFWIVAVLAFALLFSASRSQNKAIAAMFFWIPTTVLIILVVGLTGLVAYTYFVGHVRQP
jgi:FtsH-binding integral membrane protein